MSTTVLPSPESAPNIAPAPMSVFERYLTVWVFLCIVVGIALGQMLPGPFQAIGRMEIAQVKQNGLTPMLEFQIHPGIVDGAIYQTGIV